MKKRVELQEGDRVVDYEGEKGTVMFIADGSIGVRLDNIPWMCTFYRHELRKIPSMPRGEDGRFISKKKQLSLEERVAKLERQLEQMQDEVIIWS